VALHDLPPAEQPPFREGFRWLMHECRLRVGPAVLTHNINVEPERTLCDDTETVGAVGAKFRIELPHSSPMLSDLSDAKLMLIMPGLTENMALYLERGATPQAGQVLLTLYRQLSELPPQPLATDGQRIDL
jgi:hypothetical protein